MTDFNDDAFYPVLAGLMKVEIIGGKDGNAVLLHDRPLPAILKWADFDVDNGEVTLNYDTGKAQSLGLAMNSVLTAALQRARYMTVMQVDKDKIKDFSVVTFNSIGGG